MNNSLPRLAFLAVLSIPFTFLQAQIVGDPSLTGVLPTRLPTKSPSKLSAELRSLYQHRDVEALTRLLQISGDKVLVEMSMTGDVQATRAELATMGFKELGAFERLISGLMPIGALRRLETARTIAFARAVYKPVRPGHPAGGGQSGQQRPVAQGIAAAAASVDSTGVVSQGDTAIGSYKARQQYKVDGKGVKIGLISDSYFNFPSLGLDSAYVHGELPGRGNPFGDTIDIQNLGDFDLEGFDQGRAIMEVVHDVAPGAPLAFYSGFFSQSNIAAGIRKLADAGCKIIGDNEVMVWEEPFFQDGVVSKAINQAKAAGITYFTVAADYGLNAYESEYRPSAYAPFGDSIGTAHNFSAPGTNPRYLQPIVVPKKGYLGIFFQWDQNSYSVNGVRSVTTDLDIFLLDKNMQSVGFGGQDNNIANGEPRETLGYANDTDDPNDTTFYLVIIKRAGTDPGRIKYIINQDAKFYQQTDNPIPGLFAPALAGHANAEGAITVGSAYYYNTPAYGVSPPVIDSISSKAGSIIDLDTLGNHIAPQTRHKPDVVGPDAVNTSFFDPTDLVGYDYPARKGDIPQDADDLPNYFGTAAAMAHAMGTAALMMQRDSSLTPDRIKSILTSTAVDMDDPRTDGFDKGFDYATGYGFIDAYKAVGQATPPTTFIQDLNLKPLCTSDAAHIRHWEIINPNSSDIEVGWYLIGTNEHGKITVSPGDTSLTTDVPYFGNVLLPSLVVIYWKNSFDRTRIDLAFGSRAVCGQEQVSSANSDELIAGNLLSVAAALRNGTNTAGTANVAEVSPNPSFGVFRLYLSPDASQQTYIGLYSADGKQLQARVVGQSAGYVDIDASGYSPGVYYLKVQNGGFTKTLKLVKN
ncbi:MAG TPA: T9SS type A sorting domain-containing protein [Puia sp.]|nr:T9SS type A sorting domain-containing protein [Puia sp.]